MLTEKRFFQPIKIEPGSKERLIQIIKDRLLMMEGVLFAYLHGSFIHSEAFRDIDVAIFWEGRKEPFLESDLSYELKKASGFEVEVRVINKAPVAFQMAALKNGVLLFSRDEERRGDFIEKVGKRYREYAHFRNIFLGIEGVRLGQDYQRQE